MTAASTRPVEGSAWHRNLLVASGCAVVGLVVDLVRPVFPVQIAAVGLGIGLVGASFLLAWAADAGEAVFSGGLVLAVIALLAVLPEFVIETRFAYAQETELVTANLTGATRLLLTGAVGLPLAVAYTAHRRSQVAVSFELVASRRLELAILFVTSIFAIQIVVSGHLTLLDGVVLVALYALYARRVQGTPEEEPAVLGVPAGLISLPPRQRRPVIAAVTLVAGVVVVAIANPCADALLGTGMSLGIDPYFLIQSAVPLATEAPEFVIVAVLVANRRPAQGLAVFLASSLSQWTLAMGALPVAFFMGGGGTSMPLDAHQQLELGFTVALTLFAVAALVSLRPDRADAMLMVGVLAIQLIYPTAFIQLASAFVLFVFALDLFVGRRRGVRSLFEALLGRRGRS